MFSKIWTQPSIKTYSEQIERLKKEMEQADAVVVGAGSGLSASAGFTYDGPRFEEHFADFIAKYHFRDMYSAGFYPFDTLEEFWAYWSKHIYWNRYDQPVGEPYRLLLNLIRDKEYFVITTNVDHCFQNAGFEKGRLFYTQGDYGLWQCSRACHQKTYDNEETVRRMLAEQKDMRVPTELIPLCPVCGRPMSMNLRMDDTFVQDEGWYAAKARYETFLRQHKKERVVFLELGVGGNTPVIIKYPFWRLTNENPKATYACINLAEAYAPKEIGRKALCIEGDIGKTLHDLVS